MTSQKTAAKETNNESKSRILIGTFLWMKGRNTSIDDVITNSLFLSYKFHVTVRLFSNTSQRMSKYGKNISDTLDYRLLCHFFVLTTFLHHLWSTTEQTYGGIVVIEHLISHGATLTSNWFRKDWVSASCQTGLYDRKKVRIATLTISYLNLQVHQALFAWMVRILFEK